MIDIAWHGGRLFYSIQKVMFKINWTNIKSAGGSWVAIPLISEIEAVTALHQFFSFHLQRLRHVYVRNKASVEYDLEITEMSDWMW